MPPVSRPDPIAIAALVGAGSMVGHEIGYLLGGATGDGHGYFAIAGPLALAGVVVAVWMSSVSVMRRGAGRAPRVLPLAAAQTALYVCFEIGERVVGAADASLFERPVLFGLVAQPLVAWLAVQALRITEAAVETLMAHTSDAAPAAPLIGPPFVPSSATAAAIGPAEARGPPLQF